MAEKCFYCERKYDIVPIMETIPLKETFDHITPKSKGGFNYAANIVSACQHCNGLKADMVLYEYEQFLVNAIRGVVDLSKRFNKTILQIVLKKVRLLRDYVRDGKTELYNPENNVYVSTYENQEVVRGSKLRFIEDINSLKQFGKNLLFKHKIELDPFDLINSAYIEWVATRREYLIDSFKVAMYRVMMDEKTHLHRFLPLEAQTYMKRGAESCVCRKCNEILNINAFKKKEEGVYDMICIECYNIENRKNNIAYYKKKKYDVTLKVQRAKACKKYINKPEVKKKHVEKMNAYTAYQKENLTDIYIKTLLRGRGIKTPNITGDMIKQERNKILANRTVKRAA